MASGDFNEDGTWDIVDIDLLNQEIVTGANGSKFDLNGDSTVSTLDLSQWLADAATENGFAGPYLNGDSNLDGVVNAQDLNRLALTWQQSVNQWSQGDFNSDGQANAGDLNILALNWQKSIGAQAAPVPEPGVSALMIFGLTGFALRKVLFR